jgi:type II secretory pathway pseudopilin PulG
LATVALILSCLFFLPLIPIIGAILGIVALIRIGRSHGRLLGRGRAIAAIPVGFTVAFALQGMLAAVAIPSFIGYIQKAKRVEATEGLDRIHRALRSLGANERADSSGRITTYRLPRGDSGWTPTSPCCGSGQDKRCVPNKADWDRSPWKDLQFAHQRPHYYQWRYQSDGSSFTAEARGDLDCDGEYSSYVLTGSISAQGELTTRGPIVQRPLE